MNHKLNCLASLDNTKANKDVYGFYLTEMQAYMIREEEEELRLNKISLKSLKDELKWIFNYRHTAIQTELEYLRARHTMIARLINAKVYLKPANSKAI